MQPALSIRRGEPGVVDAQQYLSGVDDVPLPNQQLGKNAALEILDHLDLVRGDHFPRAPGDLVDRRVGGPDYCRHEEGDGGQQDQAAARRRALDERGAGAGHEFEIRGCHVITVPGHVPLLASTPPALEPSGRQPRRFPDRER